MEEIKLTRRSFLKTTGASVIMLSLNSFGFLGGNTEANATEKILNEWNYSGWEDLHRKEWTWDKTTWGTHLVDCYPGNCLWRVYTKDGVVFREEQAAKYPVVDPTSPDFNPRGCQKGGSYSLMMYNPDRLKYPMKRVGERGSGKWKRVSWDECLEEIAEGIVNALDEQGPESIIFEQGPGNGGFVQLIPIQRLAISLGATNLDVDSTIGDFNRGVYETFGKFEFMDSVDGWFFGKLNLIWHMNPVYTRIPDYHFIAEARYNGAEIVSIAPDYNPSSIHKDQQPRVYFWMGTNPARKNRGWLTNVLPSLWPKYKTIFGFETRWTTTLLHGDYVLPCAGFYEKLDTRFPTPHVPWLTLTEQAVKPVGESKMEWEICHLLAAKIEHVAKKRSKTSFKCRDGRKIDIGDLGEWQRMGADNFDQVMNDAIETTVVVGSLPVGSNLKKMREEGILRFTGISNFDPVALNLATDIKPEEPIIPLTWHTGSKKLPYPSYNRRMQFYIDHPWFIEANEQLPVHKDNPKVGGDYPLRMTSGHQRWSIHSIWVTGEQLLRTHQGRPFMFMNPADAKERGIADGDMVRVYNDFDDFKVHIKLTPAARPANGTGPGQVMIYHAWEPFMFKGWKSYDSAIPGMFKWLDLAAGYGHLNYWRWNWCAQATDRAISVQVEKA